MKTPEEITALLDAKGRDDEPIQLTRAELKEFMKAKTAKINERRAPPLPQRARPFLNAKKR